MPVITCNFSFARGFLRDEKSFMLCHKRPHKNKNECLVLEYPGKISGGLYRPY